MQEQAKQHALRRTNQLSVGETGVAVQQQQQQQQHLPAVAVMEQLQQQQLGAMLQGLTRNQLLLLQQQQQQHYGSTAAAAMLPGVQNMTTAQTGVMTPETWTAHQLGQLVGAEARLRSVPLVALTPQVSASAPTLCRRATQTVLFLLCSSFRIWNDPACFCPHAWLRLLLQCTRGLLQSERAFDNNRARIHDVNRCKSNSRRSHLIRFNIKYSWIGFMRLGFYVFDQFYRIS